MTTGDVVFSLRFSLIIILSEPGFDLGSLDYKCYTCMIVHMAFQYLIHKSSLMLNCLMSSLKICDFVKKLNSNIGELYILLQI